MASLNDAIKSKDISSIINILDRNNDDIEVGTRIWAPAEERTYIKQKNGVWKSLGGDTMDWYARDKILDGQANIMEPVSKNISLEDYGEQIQYSQDRLNEEFTKYKGKYPADKRNVLRIMENMPNGTVIETYDGNYVMQNHQFYNVESGSDVDSSKLFNFLCDAGMEVALHNSGDQNERTLYE